MTEFFKGLYDALKSGDIQAIFSLIGAFLIAAAPVWIPIIKGIYEKVKAKNGGLIASVKVIIEELNKEREANKDILDKSAKQALQQTNQNDAICKVLKLMCERSNLKEDTKALITKLLDDVLNPEAEEIVPETNTILPTSTNNDDKKDSTKESIQNW